MGAAQGLPAAQVIARIFIGLVSAIVLVWLGVIGLLPHLSNWAAHTYFSVLVVSILGGYAGTKVFGYAFTQLGWKL